MPEEKTSQRVPTLQVFDTAVEAININGANGAFTKYKQKAQVGVHGSRQVLAVIEIQVNSPAEAIPQGEYTIDFATLLSAGRYGQLSLDDRRLPNAITKIPAPARAAS